MLRRPLAIALLFLALASIPTEARAEDDAPPPKRRTHAEIAQQLIDAHGRGDSLAPLFDARQGPWLLVDALLQRDARDVAIATAALYEGYDREGVRAYAARGPTGGEANARRELRNRAYSALIGGSAKEAIALIEGETKDLGDLAWLQFADIRATERARAGDRPGYLKAQLECAKRAEALGWMLFSLTRSFQAGNEAFSRGLVDVAEACWERVLRIARPRGDLFRVASALTNQASIERARGQLDRSHALLDEAIELAKTHGYPRVLSNARRNKANAHLQALEYEEALALATDMRAEAQRRDEPEGTLAALELSASCLRHLGETQAALRILDEAIALADTEALRGRLPLLHVSRGGVYLDLGRPLPAIAAFRQSLAITGPDIDPRFAPEAWLQLGRAQKEAGMLAEAIRSTESARSQARALGAQRLLAGATINLGVYVMSSADRSRSLQLLTEGLELARRIRYPAYEKVALEMLAAAYKQSGDLKRCEALCQETIGLAERSGQPHLAVHARHQLGVLYSAMDEPRRAKEQFDLILPLVRSKGPADLLIQTIDNLASVEATLGNREASVRYEAEALERAEQPGRVESLVSILSGVARRRFSAGEPETALAASRRGVALLGRTMCRLSSEEAARLREENRTLYEVGAASALASGDAEAAFEILEAGRATSLLTAVHAGPVLREAMLPKDLATELAKVRAAAREAQSQVAVAQQRGRLAATRAAWKRAEEARERLDVIVERIQREARRVAQIVYPKPPSLREVQEVLGPEEALVLYGLAGEAIYAIVVTQGTARSLLLSSTSDVQALIDRAFPGDGSSSDARALGELRLLLADALRLPKATRTVLLSPVGSLAFTPLPALFDDLEVSLVPSASLLCFQRTTRSPPGRGVLALGDPHYEETRRLPRLSGAREEARALGDVVLLGRQASEEGLWKALSGRERWRAVHLACHGLVDAARPLRSSLALTRTSSSDGELRAMELLRTEIPADLAVLSACDTGLGKSYRGEGAFGLARSFLQAGVPRVVCSLWKVDDDATRTLMIKFYELWNPKEGEGLGAAAALRAAQAHVRLQEAWRDPHYWAAWVLWGLPD